MGASEFSVKVSAKTARAAFDLAVGNARHEDGHGGYTGTIAEKHEFKMVTPNAGESPTDCGERCMSDDDHFCQDKWGAAACIDCGPNPKKSGEHVFIFFGWASS